jgi:hypothetical protein
MLTGGLLWAFVNEKINKWIVFSALGIMLLVDLWGVDMRYLNHDSFQSSRRIDSTIQPRPVDNQINKDPDIHYRVHDLTANPWISAKNSLYNKSIGGNHAAKLQRYQDIIDRYLTNGNQSVFNMLNTKYFITGQPGQEQVQQNSGAFGNAWFVSNAVMASSADEEIEAIENMDLRNTASIHNEFTLSSTSFSNAGSIKLTSYHPDKLVYQSSNSGNSLAIFSEVWYGGKGWKAYIDGKEVDFIRANYVLRGLEIPTGTHEIIFEFKPNAYYKGELISMFFSIIILLLIAASIYFKFIKTNKNNILKEV